MLLKAARLVGVRRRPPHEEAAPSTPVAAPPEPTQPARAQTTDTCLAYWPEVRGNPYQRLIYGRIVDAGLRLLPLRDLAELSTHQPAPSGSILHVHWTSPVMHRAKTERDARKLLWDFMARLDDLRAAGWKLMWTVHNVLPHDCRFPKLEAQLCQEIADRCDAIHVMCRSTVDAVAQHYVLPPSRVHVIPHPSLDGVYANDVSQQDARRTLGLGDEDLVLGVLGAIRPYKRLDVVVDAFEEASKDVPSLRLLVGGAPAPGLGAVTEQAASLPNVLARFERIPDEAMPVHVNACDALVLAQSDPLNSTVVMMAFTFGRPVIAPRRGCVGELVSAETGIPFDPDVPGDLVRALTQAEQLRDDRYRRAARAKAAAVQPDEIAKQFASLASGLASVGR